MTSIDEAIAMMHEWADYECYNEEQIQASEAFNQIAVLLEELKVYQQHEIICNKGYNAGYNKAIDDCKELTFREVVYYDSLNDRTEFRELAEQLKAGVENEQSIWEDFGEDR